MGHGHNHLPLGKAETPREQQIQRITLIGAILNLILSVVKILTGWLAHSQALIADGVHSLSDLLSDGLVWYAAKHGAKDADADHPYGHGRFETLGALAVAVLLALVAAGIAWDAIDRLFHPERLLVPEWPVLVVAALSVLGKEWIYQRTKRLGKKLRSNLLMANAWHHRSDAISSIVVFIAAAGALAGLEDLDAVAAVIVAVMIGKVAWELGKEGLRELVDTGLNEDRLEIIRDKILEVDGVIALHQLRTRQAGGQALADVHILVSPRISVSEGHHIAERVHKKLETEVPEIADVVVHIDPEDDEIAAPCLHLPLRPEVMRLIEEAWATLPERPFLHEVHMHYLNGKVHLDVVLSLRENQDCGNVRRLQHAAKHALQQIECVGEVRVLLT
jgi:cation diffusion facilitator family transporter